jgi:hypothetical protein
VIARGAVFNDPAVARLLRERFVPVAIDNVDHPNLTLAEEEFLKGKGLEFCTQGISAFTAGGKVLAMGGGYEPRSVERMLTKALRELTAEKAPVVAPQAAGEAEGRAREILRPAEGGLVFHVTWKLLGGYEHRSRRRRAVACSA